MLPNRVPVFFSPPAGFPKLKDMLNRSRSMRVSFWADSIVIRTSDVIQVADGGASNVCFRSRAGTRRRRSLKVGAGIIHKNNQSARILIDEKQERRVRARWRCRWRSERLLSLAHKGQAQARPIASLPVLVSAKTDFRDDLTSIISNS